MKDQIIRFVAGAPSRRHGVVHVGEDAKTFAAKQLALPHRRSLPAVRPRHNGLTRTHLLNGCVRDDDDVVNRRREPSVGLRRLQTP
jgi:hypothetical protein